MSCSKKIVILLHLIAYTNAARVICVLPGPVSSHQNYYGIAVKALAKTGNNVSVYTSMPEVFEKAEYRKSNVTLVENKHVAEMQETLNRVLVKWISLNRKQKNEASMGLEDYLFRTAMISLDREELNKKFDLFLVETVLDQLLVLPYKWDIPVMMLSSVPPHYFNRFFGYSAHPLYYPEALWVKTDISTFWNKINFLFFIASEDMYFWYMTCFKNTLVKTYEEKMPSLYELRQNVDLMFLNANHFWDGNRPIPPGLVFLENLEHGEPEDVPQDIKTFMDFSSNGVVYMSLGTTFNTSTMMPKDMVNTFKNVFDKLKYDVLWKWDGDDMDDKPDNVRIEKWLPQKFILSHPNLKLFITHGGAHSTSEAIELGASMVVVPLLGDQFYNAERVERHAVGKQLQLTELTEYSLHEAINTVIGDPRYRQNSQRLKELWNDKPHTPVEKFIWWSQYLIRHKGARHLQSLSKNVTWSDYLVLDLMFFIVGLIMVLILFFVWLVKFVKRIFKRKNIKKNV